MVTPLDDTTLIESHKKGGKFHAFLLADTPCAMRLESFLLVFFSDAGRRWSLFLRQLCVCLRLQIEQDFTQEDTER